MNKTVLVAQPLYAHVSPVAMMSFVSFILQLPSKPFRATVFQSANMYVDNARNDAARIALGESPQAVKGITHVLYVDSDMIIPGDGLDRLLARDVQSVGGLYFGKLPPFQPVAFNFDRGVKTQEEMLKTFKRLDAYESNSLMPVDGLGMGFTLVDVDLFRKMRDKFKDENWFRAGEGIGEDVWFYMRLKQMGIQTYLDTSIQCGHVGELVVDYQTFAQVIKNTQAAKEAA